MLLAPLLGAVPSLPAGINTDDSDPLGPDRGNVTQCRYRGRMPPPFSGGSLSSSLIFLYRHYGSRIVGVKPRKTKEFKESGDVTPPALFLLHPPLCPCNKKHADPSNTKNAPNWPLKPAPKTGWRGTSNSRQSRPLPLA